MCITMFHPTLLGTVAWVKPCSYTSACDVLQPEVNIKWFGRMLQHRNIFSIIALQYAFLVDWLQDEILWTRLYTFSELRWTVVQLENIQCMVYVVIVLTCRVNRLINKGFTYLRIRDNKKKFYYFISVTCKCIKPSKIKVTASALFSIGSTVPLSLNPIPIV